MPNLKMQNVLFTNPRNCIGCRSCEVACSYHHYRENNPSRALLHVVKVEEHGVDFPVVCRHCDKAPCIDACPVGAIGRNSIGAVVISRDKCIGCRACISACPFGVIMVDPKTQEVVKCDLCEGNPKCASICPKGAIIYVRKDIGPRLLMRTLAEKQIEPLVREFKGEK